MGTTAGYWRIGNVEVIGDIERHVLDWDETSDQALGNRHAFEVWADDKTTGNNVLTAEIVSNTVAVYSSSGLTKTIGTSANRWSTAYAVNVDASGYYTSGAHGLTLAANDIAAGSATRYMFFDESAGNFTVGGAGGFNARASDGHVGLNNAAVNYASFDLVESGTGDGGSWYGWECVLTATGNITVQQQGLRLRVLANSVAVTIPTMTGAYIEVNGTGSTVTNLYGLYIATATGATNNYGVYVSPSVNNVLTGWLNVGTTTLATAQGDAAFGIGNTSGWLFYDQSANTVELRSAADASLLLTSVAVSGRQWQIVSGGGGGFTIGDFVIYNASAGGRAITVKQAAIQNDVLVISNTECVVNDGAVATMDLRVEGDTLTHLLFVDANANTNGAVGINQSAITAGFILDVVGDLRVSSGLNVGGTTAPVEGEGIFTAGMTVYGTTAPAVSGLDSRAANAFSGDITPSTLAASQNDYNPTGLSTATVLRLTSAALGSTITGLAGGVDGRIVVLYNLATAATDVITLSHEDVLSSAANRFDLATAANRTISERGTAILIYDGTASRWRCLTNL